MSDPLVPLTFEPGMALGHSADRPHKLFIRLEQEPTSATTLLCVVALVLAALLLQSCASSTAPKRSTGPMASAVLETADGLKGTKYCYAGTTTDCFDCSGFVNFCFDKIGVGLPRSSRDMFTVGTPVNDDSLKPGDLVFFNTSGKSISHVGIYHGTGTFIHASTSSGVIVSSLGDRYWGPRYVGARRVLSE